jgi:outer membrane protein OmpA-like peptidoglycan-associated protein
LPVTAPVLPIDAAVLDIRERIATLDGALTDDDTHTVRKIVVAADVLFAFDKATDPVAPNVMPDGRDNPQGRAQNRRVEISFTR